MAYSQQDKAMAVEIIQRYGGMTSEALSMIADVLGKRPSVSTLHGWLNSVDPSEKKRKQKKQIPPEAIETASEALDDLFEKVSRRYLKRALEPDVIEALKGKEAVTAAAIAVDKMRLLRDMPTEIIQLLPGLLKKLDAAGLNASDVFNAILVQIDEIENG